MKAGGTNAMELGTLVSRSCFEAHTDVLIPDIRLDASRKRSEIIG